jgi:hypothetical protein
MASSLGKMPTTSVRSLDRAVDPLERVGGVQLGNNVAPWRVVPWATRAPSQQKISRSRAEGSHFSSDIGGRQLQNGSRYRLAGTIDPSISLHV